MLCHINPDILVTMVTVLCVLKFISGTLKESLYQSRSKFIEWKLRDRIASMS